MREIFREAEVDPHIIKRRAKAAGYDIFRY